MPYSFELAGQHLAVAPAYEGGELVLEIDGRPLRARLERVDPARATYDLVYQDARGERREPIALVADSDRIHVRFRGRSYEVAAVEPLARARGEARTKEGKESVLAPMPGIVIEARAAAGDIVAPGQTLLVIESMKLQMQILCELGGRVVELPFAQGDSFDQGAVLARIERIADIEGASGTTAEETAE